MAEPVAPEGWTQLGVDIALDVQLTPELSVKGSYSWLDRDSVAVGGITDVLLGHARIKGSFGAS